MIVFFGVYDVAFLIKECPPGTYGDACVHNCIGHCLIDVICNRTTGRCDQGCKPGYIGELVTKVYMFINCFVS